MDMLVKVAAVEWGGSRHPGQRRRARCHPNPDAGEPEQASRLGGRPCLSGRLWAAGGAGDVAAAIVGVLELPWVTGQIVHADGGLALHSPIDAYGQSELTRVRSCGAQKR